MAYVAQRGPVPQWIKDLRAPGYVNIFELCDPPAIYGTETLCGDYDGELLLVAKDFAPATEVTSLLRSGVSPHLAYRHNDGDGRYHTGLKTNRQLMHWLFGERALVDGQSAEGCGAVYASACFFLKSGGTSSALPDWRPGKEVWEGSKQVLIHATRNMPNLRAIVCLGSDAMRLVAEMEGFCPPSKLQDGMRVRMGKKRAVYVAPHPSRGADVDHRSAWDFIKTDSRVALQPFR